MKRLRLIVVGLVVVMAQARAAQANIWDFLEQLSGPGPFHSRGNVLFSGACLSQLGGGNAAGAMNYFGIPPEVTSPATPCFYFDLRRLRADADGRFKEVDASAYEFGVTFPIRRPIEIGAGLGWIHFESNGASTNQFSGTPLRVVLKPLLFVPSLQTKKWPGFIKYQVKMTIIDGMAGEDFGVSNSVFDERNKHNFLTSAGFIIDVLELIHWNR